MFLTSRKQERMKAWTTMGLSQAMLRLFLDTLITGEVLITVLCQEDMSNPSASTTGSRLLWRTSFIQISRGLVLRLLARAKESKDTRLDDRSELSSSVWITAGSTADG